MTQPLFVTGMFRSGTTLLAKMLDAHAEICCANDPYLPIFKAFRNAVASDLEGAGDFERNRPLDDYYFERRDNALMTAIQAASLERPISPEELRELREGVRDYAAEFSPELAERAGRLEGDSFTAILRSAFAQVLEAYGSPDSRIAAFKAAWTDEFIGHVLEALPEAKVINILRDPRAVCASKNARPDKYPWLFLVRQWRKLAVFSWRARRNPAWRERILAIRYEDLIAEPAHWAARISAFLGLSEDPGMADAQTFKGVSGRPWGGNSSHFENVYGFNAASTDKWKSSLRPEEVAFIEHLCFPEMAAFGYEATGELGPELPDCLLFDPPRVPEESLAKWIRPREINRAEDLLREMALESLRYRASWSEREIGEELARLLFLDPEFHRAMRRSTSARAEA